MRVAYLGPRGTFSEEAVARCDLVAGAERAPCSTVADAYAAVIDGRADVALLPIENSLEGTVGGTLDLLVHRPGLVIRGETVLPVQQNLIGRAGLVLGAIRRVLSHPQALGQCAGFLDANLPTADRVPTHSTADAVQKVASEPDSAAIGTETAARHHGLQVLASSIQDSAENVTRFVLVGRSGPPATGRDRTSIAFTLDRDRPGGLHEILGAFANRALNLSKIESRPTRRELGHYIFFVDLEGHEADPAVAEALAEVRGRAHTLHLLGSYARIWPAIKRGYARVQPLAQPFTAPSDNRYRYQVHLVRS